MNKVMVFAGDGIGPEVTRQALRVLDRVSQLYPLNLEIEEGLAGGVSIDRHGVPLTPEALEKAKECGVVFLGAVGGPQWDNLPFKQRPERALLALRKELNVYANVRPVKIFSSLVERSSLKAEFVRDLDFVILRELVSGLYFGSQRGIEAIGQEERGFNTMVYHSSEIRRIARKAFEFARKRRQKVTSVDKANVLEVSQLWRKVVVEVHQDYPDVELRHRYVDDCAMQLIRDPQQFDVIVTENMFGDILSDEAAMLTGSIGMLPSASIGETASLYEPIHGSAPDIAGKDIANPLAAILSAGMMLEHSFHQGEAARAVERAVDQTLEEGYRTGDIYSPGRNRVGCSKMGSLVVERIH